MNGCYPANETTGGGYAPNRNMRSGDSVMAHPQRETSRQTNDAANTVIRTKTV